MEDVALGLELVETTDSVGELAPDNCAKLSRNATVSPSVKLKIVIISVTLLYQVKMFVCNFRKRNLIFLA